MLSMQAKAAKILREILKREFPMLRYKCVSGVDKSGRTWIRIHVESAASDEALKEIRAICERFQLRGGKTYSYESPCANYVRVL
jgi:hypothetical protein